MWQPMHDSCPTVDMPNPRRNTTKRPAINLIPDNIMIPRSPYPADKKREQS